VRILFRNGVLLDPEAGATEGSLLCEGGRIEALLRPGDPPPEGTSAIDLAGAQLCPGLIDLHVHGSLVFGGPDEVGDRLRRDSATLAAHGVTAFLPTTVAWSPESLRERLTRLAQCVTHAMTQRDWPAARPLGVHLEGPWIRAEAAGAQPREAIRPYDRSEGRELLAVAAGLVRMVTLAPEVPGAAELLDELGRRGVVAALGHTLATGPEVEEALRRGARHATHLFNAMGSWDQRGPGTAALLLAEDRLSCDLICDGVHVHPAWVRVAARAKGERLILISDRVDPSRDLREASFGSGRLLDDGPAPRLSDGRLAGSRLTLDRALRNVQDWGALSPTEAVAACTARPARLLGLEAQLGTLRAGARADLAVLERDGTVRETWVGGRRVYPPD
jgi:N-acetylglucosamine-6-phosphate deacetylase